jgi:transcriptional regulator with XRE-family HTH domain
MARKRTIVQTLAERVRELREGQGMTQADLARAADLTPSHVLKLERAAHTPKIDTIEAVATALGITVSELLATGKTSNPGPDRADRLAQRARELGDEAIEALEHVLAAMATMRGRRGG